MVDVRLELLKTYVNTIFDKQYTIEKVSDDASFRRYFRIIIDTKSYIVMDAPPTKEDLMAFIDIAHFFKNYHINTPNIYHQNTKLGFLILEDFGNTTLLATGFNLKHYQLAIDELLKIQQLPTQHLPIYTTKILLDEMNLCKEWFKQDFDYSNIFEFLLHNIKNHNQTIVHRDYHSRNLMLQNNTLGIIDFQDAVIGSSVYDLASLLKDAYTEINPKNRTTLLKYYFNQSGLTNYAEFVLNFDMISIQRHIKILGIFKRLSTRDNKHQYLKNIPLIQKYLLTMAIKYPQLSKLEALCKH